MNRQEIIEKVNEIIVNILGVDVKMLKENAALDGDIGADSLDCMEILMQCESEFQIKITDEETYAIKTVGDIYEIIEKKIA